MVRKIAYTLMMPMNELPIAYRQYMFFFRVKLTSLLIILYYYLLITRTLFKISYISFTKLNLKKKINNKFAISFYFYENLTSLFVLFFTKFFYIFLF